MKLTFKSPYLSINSFSEIDLPCFTLITGLNGAGKTHLLEAIKHGNIVADINVDPKPDIRLLTAQNFYSYNGKRKSEKDDLSEQNEEIFSNFEKSINYALQQYYHEIENIGINGMELKTLLTKNDEDLLKIIAPNGNLNDVKSKIARANQNILTNIFNNPQLTQHRSLIERISSNENVPVIGLTREHFQNTRDWGTVNLFKESLASLFVIYRDLKRRNYLKPHDGKECLSDEDFILKYGDAPWKFVNEAFKTVGLNFEVNYPEVSDDMSFELKIIKQSNKEEFLTNSMSSGEKIIFTLALALYYTQDTRQVTNYPNILLLDEIDASLHPSMCKLLIKLINDILVEKCGIYVIATTHSPTTVALAPESSLYFMKPEQSSLSKLSKAQTLNQLTIGVPSLSIEYDGRRQIFVESPNDAKIYDSLYQKMRPNLNSERSLDFISTGGKNSNGTDVNTGCNVVIEIVNRLVKAGNNRVFGLIDWDKTNPQTDKIRVIAYEKRDGLENIIFDPLLIAALIVRDAQHIANQIGLDGNISYMDFFNLNPEKLQEIVNKIQKKILGEETISDTPVEYTGGLVLQLSKSYLTMDDHDLEDLILQAFPSLKAKAKRIGELMMYIVENILNDKPEFIPKEVESVFKTLLAAPAHQE